MTAPKRPEPAALPVAGSKTEQAQLLRALEEAAGPVADRVLLDLDLCTGVYTVRGPALAGLEDRVAEACWRAGRLRVRVDARPFPERSDLLPPALARRPGP